MNQDWLIVAGAVCFGLLLLQVPATLILLSRLFKGPFRQPPVSPLSPTPDLVGAVSVVVPTLNEAKRISPCLAGLSRQSYEVREIIIVDSYSHDATPDLVKEIQQKDPRFRLINDDPLPEDWVGRPWALHNGFLYSSEQSEWILGIDADTQPQPGLVAGLVKTAEAQGYDLVSLSPQFILQYPGEWWLQPALLMTLLYRFDPAGTNNQSPERVMANGQCFLCKRSVLAALGGYTSARSSFCDDVTLARYAAFQGYKVGFLDGAKVIKVRMYEGMAQTWTEWGRSLDLKDAASFSQILGDLWLLLSVQALPLIIVFTYLLISPFFSFSAFPFVLLLRLNLFLLAIRFALLFAIAPSYDRTNSNSNWTFWLSPLADPLAFLRILLSSLNKPTQWRGRSYAKMQKLEYRNQKN
ncbi:glycosyltransferase [Phormidium sp. LEGE 05292]|uniref:2'-O-glycosyltransferase CruG n=1 Tax=[Phormidium] sp. LEGE 05292 TaxID=767427 RepID=UPI00187EADF0|nr:glycosyltransferase family 2 protein [Phormidium sp. LEGE 05292]MBE9225771.1 glycosyltransferase [Phormidium sp. LEGE 05292]